jgi:hypothetical protein
MLELQHRRWRFESFYSTVSTIEWNWMTFQQLLSQKFPNCSAKRPVIASLAYIGKPKYTRMSRRDT